MTVQQQQQQLESAAEQQLLLALSEQRMRESPWSEALKRNDEVGRNGVWSSPSSDVSAASTSSTARVAALLLARVPDGAPALGGVTATSPDPAAAAAVRRPKRASAALE